MKVFAMVTTKASWEYTSYALKSIFRNTKFEEGDVVYLIDNDTGFEEDASWFSPTLQIIKNEKPLSFASNMNMILEIARSKQADFFILQNDIIFTSDWMVPLLEEENSIISSISNAHTESESTSLEWKEVLKLNQYLGKESQLKEIVKLHKTKTKGYKKMLSVPFFCLRIPNKVYEKTGLFDENFIIAGYEDHDYCLRAYKAGFDVKYAKQSLLLHFGGKSTWAGAEKAEQTLMRKRTNQEVFDKKWGEKLRKLCAENDQSALNEDAELLKLYQDENFAGLIEKLCPN
jgi:GT2 family glycosyltransferase